jgi:hypothetical protein
MSTTTVVLVSAVADLAVIAAVAGIMLIPSRFRRPRASVVTLPVREDSPARRAA